MSRAFHEEIGRSVGEGMATSGGFFGSIMAGFLLGFLADRWLGIEPWLVIIGIIVGAVWGFYQMWRYAMRNDER